MRAMNIRLTIIFLCYTKSAFCSNFRGSEVAEVVQQTPPPMPYFPTPPSRFLIQNRNTGKCLGVVADFTTVPSKSTPSFLIFKPFTCDISDVRQTFYYSAYGSTIIKVGKPEAVNPIDVKKNYTQQNWCMDTGKATKNQQVSLRDCMGGNLLDKMWSYNVKSGNIVNKAASQPLGVTAKIISTDSCLTLYNKTAGLFTMSQCNSSPDNAWNILGTVNFQATDTPNSPVLYIGTITTPANGTVIGNKKYDGRTSDPTLPDSVCLFNPSYLKVVASSYIENRRCRDVLSIYSTDKFGYNVVMTYDKTTSQIRTHQPLPKNQGNICLTANLNDRATFTVCNPANAINQQWVFTSSHQIQLQFNMLYCLESGSRVWSVQRCVSGKASQAIGYSVAEYPVNGLA